MLTGTHPALDVSLTSQERSLQACIKNQGNAFLLADVVPSLSELVDVGGIYPCKAGETYLVRSAQTRLSEPASPAPYSENDYRWLVGELDALSDFVHRSADGSVSELTETDYHWAHALLVELTYIAGQLDTHPLASVMEFTFRLVEHYDDKYVPGLIEEAPIEEEQEVNLAVPIEYNSQPCTKNITAVPTNELAAHAFFSLGCLLWEGGRAAKAISAYDTALHLNSDFVSAYNNRGNLKNGLHNPRSALDDYDVALRLKPHFTVAYNNRGATKASIGRYTEALVDLNEAIRLEPKAANAYANRGMVKGRLGRLDEARCDFQTALGLAAQHQHAALKTRIEKQLQGLENPA